MDIESIGARAGIIVSIIIGNAFVMKLIIDNAIKTLHLLIAKDYVTQEDFDRHIETCPYARMAKKEL